MKCYFLFSVLVRPTQAARLFLLRFLRTYHRLILVQAAEDPSFPARLESSTPASFLVEQQQLQTIFFILSEHLSQTEMQHRYPFFPDRHFVSYMNTVDYVCFLRCVDGALADF